MIALDNTAVYFSLPFTFFSLGRGNVHCSKNMMQECRKANGVKEKIALKRNGQIVNVD